jgi:8-hydroxy-5-deazaflavin:NADPH oxidoreductase
MKIGILGAGNIGGGLARAWAAAGHQVMVSGSRDPAKLEAVADQAGHGAETGSLEQAAAFGEVVVLALLWPQVPETLAALAPVLQGKVLIDASNPLTPDFVHLAIGHTDSGGETVARMLPGVRVVKAYNSVGANIIGSADKRFGGVAPTLFFCGEDAEAKQVVAGLIADSGFEPFDVGGIATSRFLEPLEQLWVEILKSGIQQEFILSLLRR